MSLQQFLLALRAWRWVVFSVMLVVVATAVAVSLVLPKTYQASSSVVVDVKSSDPVVGSLMPNQMLPGYMATQIDIISSPRVARHVVKTLKLDQDPAIREEWRVATKGRGEVETWVADDLQKRLEVRPARESSVISIAYSGPDAAQAARLANAFAQAYIDVNLELKVDPARQYAAWFDERNKSLRGELEAAQKKLSDFQQAQGIVATDERLDLESARLAELSSQLSSAQSLRADSQSRERQTVHPETLPEVVQNNLIQNLRADLSRLEAERDQVSARFGPNHPDFKKVAAELTAVRERLSLETQRIANSLGTANRVSTSREADVRAALETQKKRVLELKAQRDQIAVLQRDVESAQHAYDLVTQRQAQTNLESENRQTNIAVLTYAVPPLRASGPKIIVNTLFSIVLGALLGIAAALLLEFSNRRIRSEEDLAASLGLPVLASLDGPRHGWFASTAPA
ncbi:MAG: epsF [Rhodocyclales bacterium]|nr:epsF [Rhodocyclales bacterium]